MNLTIDATQTVRTVDERVFGLNATIWDGQAGTPQTISLLQAAGVRTIRIPGGSLSDEYHWRTNTNLANTWTWASGFDSYTKLISGLNAQAFVTINYGTGTPQEAAAWVAYANASASLLGTGTDVSIGIDSKGYDWKTAGYWSALRNSAPLVTNDGMNFLRISRADPLALKYWEIGNENYGTWETDGQAVKNDPYTYSVRAKDYIAKMKSIDPTIKIGVVAVTTETANVNNTSHPATNPRTGIVRNGWTPVMLTTLKNLGVAPDYLIYHRYEQAPAADQPANPETDAGLLQKAKTWPADASDLRQQLTDYLGAAGAGVELIVTENNSVYGKPGKQTTSLVNGLYYADSIGNIMQTEFNALVWWDLRNGQDNGAGKVTSEQPNLSASLYGWRQYGDYGIVSSPSSFGSTTAYDPYPTYYVMKLLSKFARGGDTVVQATSNNTLLSVFAVKRLNGSLNLLVINKDRNFTQAATVTLAGYNPASSAVAYSYGVPQDEASHIRSGSSDIANTDLNISGPVFSVSFAPYSATVISLEAAPVYVAPAITVQPTNETVSSGGSAFFKVVATGIPAASLQWQCSVDGGMSWFNLSDDGVYSGSQSGTLILNRIGAGATGNRYRCRVGNGTGNIFSEVVSLTVFIACGDFDGDGAADLLWSNAGNGMISGWTAAGFQVYGIESGGWRVIGAGDFDGDDRAEGLWHNAATGVVACWSSGGHYLVLGMQNNGWAATGAADFDGDGKDEVLWRYTPTGMLAAWSSSAGFTLFGYEGGGWSVMGTGDFDGDGKADMLWRNSFTGVVSAVLADGVGLNLDIEGGGWTVIGTGKFNGDNRTDLLWHNTVTGVVVAVFTGGGSLTLGVENSGWLVIGTGDFDGDGRSDVLWRNRTTGLVASWTSTGQYKILGVEGDGWSIIE